MSNRNACKGHTTAEFGILSVFVLVGAIGVLSLMGTNISNLFTSFHVERTSPGSAQVANTVSSNGGAALSNTPNSAANNTVAFGQSPLPPGVGQEQVCFKSNFCTSILSIQGGNTDTSGGNGTQLVLGSVNSLDQLIKQMKNDPNADNGLVALLTQLANQGHDIGTTISVPVNTDPSNDNRSSVGSQIVTQIDSLNATKFAVLDYVQAHPNSLDPVVKDFVTAQADNIQTIGRSRTDLSGCTGGECGPTGVVYFKDSGTADLVHQDANSICKSGGNENQCVQ